MPRARDALIVGACLVAFACKRAPTSASATDAGDSDASAIADAAPALLPARCKPGDEGATLAEGADLDALEIGEATTTSSGFALGVLRKGASEVVGSVALASRDAKSVSFVDLAPPYADAPP